MEHIQLYDWNTFKRESHFVEEGDIDNCVIEKILRNKFIDPTISSEEEDEVNKQKINWDEVFSKKQMRNFNKKQINVPGMRMFPPYPKLSSLSVQQHYQCLKVLCAENPDILDTEFMPRPTKNDLRVFREIQEIYMNEQQEYREWAKQQWTTTHCLRALRLKPDIEMVYDSEFKVQIHAMQAFPKTFEMAAQIPLETNNASCDLVLVKDIINVDIEQLPEIQVPAMVTKKFVVTSETAIPEPCIKHPCRFVLPNESSMTILPLPEVHRELAQFAVDNDVTCVISEEALQCIIEQGRKWELALSVCEIVREDSERVNVIVISNEFFIEKPSSQTRNYRAYTHILHGALIPLSERRKLYSLPQEQEQTKELPQETTEQYNNDIDNDVNDSSDDEDGNSLFIDTGETNSPKDEDVEMQEINQNDQSKGNAKKSTNEKDNDTTQNETSESGNKSNESIIDESQIGIYSCSCKDTIFENPPRRSFKKWKVSNNKNRETYDLIIHCSHKTRLESSEVVLEPIVEYQIDLGGSEQSNDKLTSLATSLLLRNNARLVNVRIDSGTGELVTVEQKSLDELQQTHNVDIQGPANYLYTMINQLQGLLPGEYVLHHDSTLGRNAFLYAPKCTGGTNKLTIPSVEATLPRTEYEEAGSFTAPVISQVLLPYHKFRKILPCAFTPFHTQMAREPRRPITRQKHPPQASLWPKKKKKGKKK